MELEIENLFEEIIRGRTEASDLEVKRQWWNLNSEAGKQEFAKDVSAMANAIEDAQIRRIVLGFKNGKQHPAPLPRDEADLQQILQSRVDPVPNVSFRQHEFNNKTVCVVEIRAPFDHPYVTSEDNRNIVYVRMGSTITTASRKQLDAYYRGRSDGRAAELSVKIRRIFLSKVDGSETSGDLEPVLYLRKVSAAAIDHLRKELINEANLNLAQVKNSSGILDVDWVAKVSDYKRKWTSYVACLNDSRCFQYVYIHNHDSDKTMMLHQFVFENQGSITANNVSIKLRLPDWLLPLDYCDFPDSMTTKPQIPQPETLVEKLGKSLVHSNDLFLPIVRTRRHDAIDAIIEGKRSESSKFQQNSNTIMIDIPTILHRRHFTLKAYYYFSALPHAPISQDDLFVELEIIHDAIEDYQVIQIPVVWIADQ